jgi:hypothetical protein
MISPSADPAGRQPGCVALPSAGTCQRAQGVRRTTFVRAYNLRCAALTAGATPTLSWPPGARERPLCGLTSVLPMRRPSTPASSRLWPRRPRADRGPRAGAPSTAPREPGNGAQVRPPHEARRECEVQEVGLAGIGRRIRRCHRADSPAGIAATSPARSTGRSTSKARPGRHTSTAGNPCCAST